MQRIGVPLTAARDNFLPQGMVKLMLKFDVLRRKEDFDRIYRKGKSVGDRYVVVFCLKNGLEYSRIAFLASKKVGNSVERNRARRLMRESVRLSDIDVRQGYDLIVIARNTINGRKCADVKKSIEAALKRLKVTEKRR